MLVGLLLLWPVTCTIWHDLFALPLGVIGRLRSVYDCGYVAITHYENTPIQIY